MTASIADIQERLRDCTNADPLLPRPNPTIAFWQEPEHPTVSKIQSESLATTSDIVVIGSGITACSVVKSILENPAFSGQRVTVLEARLLCSGATGRNGGHLVSDVVHGYPEVAGGLGKEMAREMVKFSLQCVERVKEIIQGLDVELKDAAELRDLVTVCAIEDDEAVQHMRHALHVFEQDMPEYRDIWTLHEGDDASEKFGLRAAKAVLSGPGAAFWSYQLITGLFERLLAQHADRLMIETSTPVTGIHQNPLSGRFKYTVTTSRGSIEASKVIHCTNGHASHLLPQLRGKIFPFRGTMSTQKAGPSFPNLGSSRSWSSVGTSSLDMETGIFTPGLIYVTQNSETGDVFVGGERQRYDEILCSDDTTVPAIPKTNIATILPRIFKGWDGAEPEARRIWSGVMGFTADGVPIVGQLPNSLTGREGTGEWIAAGFNGDGMDKCWLCGEALVGMIAGDEGAPAIPRAYAISEARFEEGMKENVWINFICDSAP